MFMLCVSAIFKHWSARVTKFFHASEVVVSAAMESVARLQCKFLHDASISSNCFMSGCDISTPLLIATISMLCLTVSAAICELRFSIVCGESSRLQSER